MLSLTRCEGGGHVTIHAESGNYTVLYDDLLAGVAALPGVPQ